MNVAGVPISNPDRVMFEELGLRKIDLVRYHEAVAPWMVPQVRGRPLTLYWCPKGVAAGCRFMRHAKVWGPSALRRVNIQEKTKVGEYLVVDDTAGLVALAQMDVIEVHTWNSTTEHIEEPDRIVIDLDPGPAVAWPQVVAVARRVRDAFTALGLDSLVKTTGGAGLHVVAPIRPERDVDFCLAFSRALAQTLAADDPKHLTVALTRAGRESKILLDYLRNNRTNTSVAAYSLRARAGAPVSMPLAWDELGPRRPQPSITTILTRLRDRDPWADYDQIARQRLRVR